MPFICLALIAHAQAAQEAGHEKLLLKDYRPRAIYNLPTTKLSQARSR